MSEIDEESDLISRINKLIPVQVLSIQWLNWNKIEREKLYDTENWLNTVEGIVKLHNANNYNTNNPKKKDVKNLKKEDPNNLKKKDENEGYVKNPDIIFPVSGYSFVVYTCTILRDPQIAQQTQVVSEKKKTEYYLVFFFKQNPRRLIALSSGQAWRVVRHYADHSFPVKIAEKVADPKKMKQLTRHCLFGHITQQKWFNPTEYDLYKTSNLYYFVENFICHLKKDSSLFHLIKEIENVNCCWIKVTTGGMLRIERKIALANFPRIFDQLPKYVEAEPTLDISNRAEIPDPMFEFLHFLQPAPKSKDELDKQFVKDIFAQWNETKEPLVDVRPANVEDFFFSTKFEIKTGSRRYQSLGSEPPGMREIIEKINATDLKAFEEAMLKGRLKYSGRESNPRGASLILIDCVEGQMHFEGKTYFKVKKMWYILTEDHLALLCDDFQSMVRKYLIVGDNHEAQLPIRWAGSTGNAEDTRKAEKMYNRSYLREDLREYLVLDKILPDDIESCDILKRTQNRVYLYQVKEKFNKSTREACSQILNAATMLRGALPTVSRPSSYLEKLWDMATKGSTTAGEEWRNDLKRRVEPLGKDGFFDIFRQKLVFVYAYLPEKGESFQNLLKKIDEPIEERIIRKLIDSGYYNSYGRFTDKFYSETKKKFRLQGETVKTREKIYDQLAVGRFFKSTIAKFELVRLAQNLQELNFEFKICEIPRAESGEANS